MWPYHPDLLSTPVPRYTSFPTAAEFGTAVDETDLEAALATAGGEVSLYLHIPFCEAICWYCGCNTGRANKRQRLASYLDALHREIALVGSRLPASARVRRIAFGGGSPNAIQPTDFVRLMLALTQAFPLDRPEISIELDPRTLDREWTRVLGRVGVTRASLGVQTFDAAAQAAIGRVQPTHLIERCTALLREAGVTSLNYDLMYGLPGQDRDVLKASLALTHMLGADRVALFGYAHVPHLIPRQQKIDAAALPGQAERFAMAAFGHDWLIAAGYEAVGFDHFARPGDPLAAAARAGKLRRNFQGFTDDRTPVLIGLGASAISSFPGLLVQNEKNAGRYRMLLSQDRLPVERGLRRSDDDRRRGTVIAGLLCQGRARLDAQLRHEVGGDLDRFVDAGLADLAGEDLVILPGGLPYARTIAALFDPYRRQAARRFSSAV
ncbi:oxygen-independent coproporphyrinogen III oxidase [Novosphingobium sp. PS1R-30]|uniref:Coproporphyrinogen-III oxidase n=1 Tax=Novosphingobium anseongense TaxID=3133436 RepID=A0ABU8RWQ0_9SPHN